MDKDLLINDFATRCFREVADQDYISARLSYRSGLYPQFHWQSLQAIEKYLKAILLYNRIKAKNINHDLITALKYTKKLPFEIQRSDVANEFIEHLARYGRFRYLEASYHIEGPKLVQLDKTVWEVRRYCKVLNYDLPMENGQSKNMLASELNYITDSQKRPRQLFKIPGGLLEKIIQNKKHPARNALIWKNLFYGESIRHKVSIGRIFVGANSPLTIHPEILENVLEYIHLPKDVINAYRQFGQEIARRNKKT